MNIVIYSHAFPPSIGGSERAALDLAQGLVLKDSQIKVCVVTQTLEKDPRESSWPFQIVRRPSMGTLWRILAQADLIHCNGPVLIPLLIATFLCKKRVVEHYGYQAICPNGLLLYSIDQSLCSGRFQEKHYIQCLHCNTSDMGWRRGLRRFLVTFLRSALCRYATAHIGISSHVVERLEFPRSEAIYYGVDASSDSSQTQQDVPVFAYVGRLVPEKGLSLILQAAASLGSSPYQVWFIGDGPERVILERESQALGLSGHVRFLGFLIGEALKSTLKSVDAVVMPSIWEETAGLAAMEQMMQGRLVIAADVGGLGEVVGETGLKFAVGDAQSLTACMRQAIEKPELRREKGSQARQRAMHYFNRQQAIEKHWALYQKLMIHE